MKTKIDYKSDFAFRYILGSNTPDGIYLLTISILFNLVIINVLLLFAILI